MDGLIRQTHYDSKNYGHVVKIQVFRVPSTKKNKLNLTKMIVIVVIAIDGRIPSLCTHPMNSITVMMQIMIVTAKQNKWLVALKDTRICMINTTAAAANINPEHCGMRVHVEALT